MNIMGALDPHSTTKSKKGSPVSNKLIKEKCGKLKGRNCADVRPQG